ncbi:MAG: AAA domain-containing protein [Actinobacteria bacterium]|nr:AAA domain-containing protein [Actinomycetota bacterium]
MLRRRELLFITNRPSTASIAESLSQEQSYGFQTAATPADGLHLLAERQFDLILLDIDRSPEAVLQCLRTIRHDDPEALVFVVLPGDDVSTAVAAMKHGAADVLIHPLAADAFAGAVRSVLLATVRPPVSAAGKNSRVGIENNLAIVGQTDVMRQVEHLIAKVAPTDATVLICGESGTGKELVAKAIHLQSSRRRAAFVAVDCSSLVENLFESELFGHVKGSFTGATVTKHGRFELADGGTIFLDEIGQISPNLQGKLLRVLQEREITKVGSNQVVKVDVRVIAATNTQLQLAAAQGKFRRELFYRLHVLPILLPPLRQRKPDILLLAQHFLEKYRLIRRKNVQGISPKAEQRMLDYDWPGNVRELEHVIERAVVLADGPVIMPRDLTYFSVDISDEDGLPDDGRLATLERLHIAKALSSFDGHRARTAEYLGIDRKTLRAKIIRYGLSD